MLPRPSIASVLANAEFHLGPYSVTPMPGGPPRPAPIPSMPTTITRAADEILQIIMQERERAVEEERARVATLQSNQSRDSLSGRTSAQAPEAGPAVSMNRAARQELHDALAAESQATLSASKARVEASNAMAVIDELKKALRAAHIPVPQVDIVIGGRDSSGSESEVVLKESLRAVTEERDALRLVLKSMKGTHNLSANGQASRGLLKGN